MDIITRSIGFYFFRKMQYYIMLYKEKIPQFNYVF